MDFESLELWICPELNIQEPRLCAAQFLIGEGRGVVCVGVDIQFSNQLVLEQATVTTIPGRPQCPAGTRTRPDTRYFIWYPTRPDSFLKIIG